jgi:hypothetical protein
VIGCLPVSESVVNAVQENDIEDTDLDVHYNVVIVAGTVGVFTERVEEYTPFPAAFTALTL